MRERRKQDDMKQLRKKQYLRASFRCGMCGQEASLVTLVLAGQADPRVSPQTPGIPTGVSMLKSDIPRLSIDGGPVTFTIGVGNESLQLVRDALLAKDAAGLHAINEEFTPFWCPECGCCYCELHYTSHVIRDLGFFDSIWGKCPKGHSRKLID